MQTNARPLFTISAIIITLSHSCSAWLCTPRERRRVEHPTMSAISNKNKWLVVDYDGTVTENDTTPLLPRLASLASGRSSEDLRRRLSQFKELEDEYLALYSEAKNSLDETEDLHCALDGLDHPSTAVTRKVSQSGVLEGLGGVNVSEMSKLISVEGTSGDPVGEASAIQDEDKVSISLRDGVEHTLARILVAGSSGDDGATMTEAWNLGVLSINWSRTLIEASLVQPVLRKRRALLDIDSCDTEIAIWSNDVDEDGSVTLNYEGSVAKKGQIKRIRNRTHEENSNIDGEPFIVYVGDSSTDLLALIEADLGIIMGHKTSAISIARRWGYRVDPLADRHKAGDWTTKGILWTTNDWHEIDKALAEL